MFQSNTEFGRKMAIAWLTAVSSTGLAISPLQTDMEYQHPHSQERVAGYKRQTAWAQSLYILGELLYNVSIALC